MNERQSKSQIHFLCSFLKEIAFNPNLLLNDYVMEFLKNNHEKTFARVKKVRSITQEGTLESPVESISELRNLVGMVEGEISENLDHQLSDMNHYIALTQPIFQQ